MLRALCLALALVATNAFNIGLTAPHAASVQSRAAVCDMKYKKAPYLERLKGPTNAAKGRMIAKANREIAAAKAAEAAAKAAAAEAAAAAEEEAPAEEAEAPAEE